MVLNIFPRRKESPAAAAPAIEPEELPEPSPELLAELPGAPSPDGDEPRKRTRRGSRGGRGRRRTGEADGEGQSEAIIEGEPEAAAETEPVAEPASAAAITPARGRRVRKTAAAPTEAEPETAASEAPAVPETQIARSRRARPKPIAAAAADRSGAEAPAPVQLAPAAAPVPAPRSREVDGAAVLRAVEQQSRQIEQLIRMQEEAAKRTGQGAAAPPARVGVFVDAANIELACDRLRARFDWGKVLAMLTKDRQLVRAVAYSPVHDDPGVSLETQRFAEPFLGRGFKVVTKALKRFSDGTVKANVDIELALDVVRMLDRMDVVCLVSGDGDFQPLVEFVQSRGVRCEVVAVAASTAVNLRNAADEYIDLGSRLKDLRA